MRVLEFEDAARAKDREGGGDDKRGVPEAREEGAAVDVVEFLGVGPFFFCVGDFEAAVWWDAGRCQLWKRDLGGEAEGNVLDGLDG